MYALYGYELLGGETGFWLREQSICENKLSLVLLTKPTLSYNFLASADISASAIVDFIPTFELEIV